MPIMDGLEACQRIYKYLSQENGFFGILPKSPSYNGIVTPKKENTGLSETGLNQK
jgi:hypothetical protein